jgi:hypothetical protein
MSGPARSVTAVLDIALVGVFVLAVGCNNGDGGDSAGTVTEPTTDSVTTTRSEATTTTAQQGDAGPGCVNGWTTPAPGTAVRREPLDVIRAQMGVTGEFQIDEMRYFTGPEVPWIIEPRPPLVERWYVKAQLVDDPTFRARWLVEKRSPTTEGIAAVAPFDTTGYRSPDWRGFVGEGEPRTIEGLPGSWAGIEYDFVTGEGDGGNPGLPDEVIHCFDDT